MKTTPTKTKGKTLTLLLYVFLLNCGLVLAQTPSWTWVKSTNGPSDEYAGPFVTDNQGNVITRISYTDTFNYDGTSIINPGNLGSQTAIIKTSPTGDLIWKREFGSPSMLMLPIQGLDTDPFGNVLISGTITNLGTPVNYPIGDITISSSNTSCGFLIKITPAGYILWAKVFSPDLFINSVKTQTDSNGNIFVAGAFAGTLGIGLDTFTAFTVPGNFHDFFLAKLDSSGNYLWSKHFGSNADEQQLKMAKSSDGGVFIASTWFGDSVFVGNLVGVNPNPLPNSNQDRWLTKIDGQGNPVWLKTENGSGEDPEAYLAGDASGGVLTMTSVSTTAPISLNGTTYNTDGALLTYYNQSGTLTTVKHFPGIFDSYSGDISLGASGNFYMVLNSTGQQVTIGSNNFTNAGGSLGTSDGFLAKINNSLQPLWAMQLGNDESEKLTQLRAASDGKLVVIGVSNNETLNFGTSLSISNVGTLTNDGFIAGLDEPTGIANIENPGSLMVFPNPVKDLVRIKSDAPIGSTITIDLTDGTGRLINSTVAASEANNFVDLSECKAGIYFLKVTHQNFVQTARIVKQ